MANELRTGKRLMMWLSIGFVAFAAGYLAVSYMPAPVSTRYIAQGAYYLTGLLAAVVLTGYAMIKATRNNRFFWLAVFGGTVMFLAGEVYWVVYDMIKGVGTSPPSPSFSDITTITGYIFLYIAVMSMARFGRAATAAKARYLIDTLIVILFATIIYWALILSPMLARPDLNAVDTIFTAVYQLLDIGLLFGVLANLFGFKVRNWRVWEGYIAAGVILRSLADFGYGILVVNDAYHIDNIWANLTDISWLAGYFMFAAAGIFFLRKHETTLGNKAGSETLRAVSSLQEVGVVAVIAIGLPFYVLLGLSAAQMYERLGFAFTGALAIALAVLWGILVIQENNQLLSKTVIDSVSGLSNNEYFQERLIAEINRAKRFTENFSVAVIDINGLEQINNVIGYAGGDAVLAAMGAQIKNNIRLSDVACRIGGDEFALILPETDKREALKICHAIQADIMEQHIDGEPDVVLAWGIAGFPQDGEDVDSLLKKADDAVYWHKFYDNTQICVIAEPLMPDLTAEVDLKAEKKAYIKAVMAMAAAVDARDPFTRFHSKNVARMAKKLAEEMGLPDETVKLIETAGLVHDVGRIGIPDRVLRKHEPLSAEDQVWIREHPVLGERMLAASTVPEILPWIAAHHEQWDGTGYPKGIEGEKIPLEAAILGVCDAYDAMTSDRAYRSAMTQAQALAEIDKHSGSMFHPIVAQMFLGMIKAEKTS